MKVLIVGKTRKYQTSCIGAVKVDDARPLRLQQHDGSDFPLNTSIQVGQLLDVEGRAAHDVEAPHLEDFYVTKLSDLGKLDVRSFVMDNCPCEVGPIEQLFDGSLRAASTGTLRVLRQQVPTFSTQFWITDHDLVLFEDSGKEKYSYRAGNGRRKIPYVGFQEKLKTVPVGSLVRMSLAKWPHKDDMEDACYLQLSGWFVE